MAEKLINSISFRSKFGSSNFSVSKGRYGMYHFKMNDISCELSHQDLRSLKNFLDDSLWMITEEGLCNIYKEIERNRK